MWPLLRKDGLGVQYFSLTVLWNAALGYTPFKRPKNFIQTVSLVSNSVALIITGIDVTYVHRVYLLRASPFISWNSLSDHQPGTRIFSPS